MIASSKENIDVVDLLVNKGANLDITNKEGMTALMIACENANIEIISFLVNCEADINIQDDVKKISIY